MNYQEKDTLSLSDGCRLINTNLPRLKRLAGKGHYQIVEVRECRHQRIPIEDFLDYARKMLDRNGKERQFLKDSITELTTSLILSQADELGMDEEMRQEFTAQLNYLGFKEEKGA